MKLNECFEANGLSGLLDEEKEERLSRLCRLLLDYNEKVNLTAITDPDQIYVKHMADSAFLARYLEKDSALIDIGCGGGFPSLPVAILRPDVSVTAVDSTEKKLRFVSYVAEQLGINNIKTVCGRAEELCVPGMRGLYDAATARAVAPLPVLCELCVPYLKKGGVFLAMKTDESEVKDALSAAAATGAVHERSDRYTLKGPDFEADRCVIVFRKTEKTNEKYPRRYSLIKSKPL
ncbi:MAG: 16S rRNA (guanine(527)-N(7))-methyltransferase RsmG [Clostridia bacterium]|nr:16S rRNA (guanine(527)-N(7))-methyltransferase RsmG [Clostridia bacterium]